jgi:hypothetical protein
MQCIAKQPILDRQPSPQLIAFVERLNCAVPYFEGLEQRWESRHLIVMQVLVQPIDDERRPIARPLTMVTRDLSTWGVGLVHDQLLSHNRLALRLTVGGDEVLLVGELRWRKPIGPFYLFGCQVTAKLDHFPDFPAQQL